MRSAWKIVGWTLLIGLAFLVALGAGAAWIGALAHTTIQIDGETLTLASLSGAGGLAAIGGVMLAMLVLLLVVPLTVLLPLLAVAFALLALLAVLAGVTALAFSPLIVMVGVVWVIVRLLRGGRRRGASS